MRGKGTIRCFIHSNIISERQTDEEEGNEISKVRSALLFFRHLIATQRQLSSFPKDEIFQNF